MEDIEINENTFPTFFLVLDEYCINVENRLRNKLIQNGRVASGQLTKTLQTYVKSQGANLVVYLISTDYLQQITEGRAPTRNGGDGTLQRKIFDWIKQKNILPTPRQDKNGKTYLPTQEQLAYLITRKIHREGYKGDNSLYDVLTEINKQYIPLLQEALEKDFEQYYSIKILKEINRMIKI